MRRTKQTLLVGAWILALGLKSVWAGNPPRDGSKESKGTVEGAKSAAKLPNPAGVLQKVAKSLAKARSYRACLDVQGGFATRADHEVTEVTVRESYEGEIYGTLMSCKQVKAFRTQKKGAAYIEGHWRDLLSDRSMTKMERLFRFPEEIFDRALRNAPKGATWLSPQLRDSKSPGVSSPKEEEDETSSGVEEQPDGGPATGRTVVVKKAEKVQKPAEAAVALPRFIRVELPPEEALTALITVQNSNCFGGG